MPHAVPSRRVAMIAALVAAGLAAHCTRQPEQPETAMQLSGFAKRLLHFEHEAVPPLATTVEAEQQRLGIWSVSAAGAGCADPLIGRTRVDAATMGLGCRGFDDCLSAIVDGMQSAGISRTPAQLIRVDAQSGAGLRLRFEAREIETDGRRVIYTAHIILVPGAEATTAATLITKDVGESYECFDRANRVFTQFVKAGRG